MAEVPQAGGVVAGGRPALDLNGLSERWTPQIAATRRRAGRVLMSTIACLPIVFVIAPVSEANNSWPGVIVALAMTAFGLGLMTYSLVLQQRTRRAVSDLYAIARDERPPLEPLRVRTVAQFDAWLGLHDRVPADREPGRLERSADGSIIVVPLNDAVRRHGGPAPGALLGKKATAAVGFTWLGTVLLGVVLIVATGSLWVIAVWFALVAIEWLAIAALIRSRRRAARSRQGATP